MGLKKATVGEERRELDRTAVGVTMPVQVLIAASHEPYPCRIFDVSRDGLAIVGAAPLAEGTELTFVTLKARIALVVAWCHAEPVPAEDREVKSGKGPAYRSGLRLVPGSGDLAAIFPGYLASSPRA